MKELSVFVCAFEITDSSVKVTIPYNWMWKTEGLVDKLAEILSETEFKILKAIKEYRKLVPTRNWRA